MEEELHRTELLDGLFDGLSDGWIDRLRLKSLAAAAHCRKGTAVPVWGS